jgi:hypothetical protein
MLKQLTFIIICAFAESLLYVNSPSLQPIPLWHVSLRHKTAPHTTGLRRTPVPSHLPVSVNALRNANPCLYDVVGCANLLTFIFFLDSYGRAVRDFTVYISSLLSFQKTVSPEAVQHKKKINKLVYIVCMCVFIVLVHKLEHSS